MFSMSKHKKCTN